MRSAIGRRVPREGGRRWAMGDKGRTFGALIVRAGVFLVEFRTERTGTRVVGQWSDVRRFSTMHEAAARLRSLISSLGITRASIALTIEQFGVFHHVMVLPAAADDVLRPVIRREVQQVFGVADPFIAFSGDAPPDRRAPRRQEETSTRRQLFIAGAPPETLAALREELSDSRIRVTVATVISRSLHRLYEAAGAPLEPTAVVACLETGPHVAFFLDGRLELTIDPPSSLDGEHPSVKEILGQIGRGAVDFQQHFPGTALSRVLLAARQDHHDELAAAIENALGARVSPLCAGVGSPEAVVAMGAMLEAQYARPLDLFPHPPSISERVAVAFRGPNVVVAGTVAAAVAAALWSAGQVTTLTAVQHEVAALQENVRAEISAVGPMRQVAERRADFASEVAYLRDVRDERSTLAQSLAAIVAAAPDGIRFDSMRVARSTAGWNGSIEGQAIGATAAQTVRGLDLFFQEIRNRPGIASASLDRFDYLPAAADSTRQVVESPVLQFRVSFTMPHVDAPGMRSAVGPAPGVRH